MIDQDTEFGARVAEHLLGDPVVWLTTVTPSGAPVPNPVWFLWEGGDEIRMFSRDHTDRVRNLDSNPRVSLNFRGTEVGGDIVVFSGRASIERDGPQAHEVPGYVDKYRARMERMGLTPEEFTEQYPVPIRIRLTRLRGF